jgi:hypothetical protein
MNVQRFIYLRILFLWLGILYVQQACAQIGPPDLGNTNTAAWTAFGIRQSLDSASKIQSFSYIGFGRLSTLASYNPFYRHAILVLNQEFYHRFSKQFRYSLGVSYRNKNEYSDTSPYESASPSAIQEFRVYGRFIYQLKVRKFKFVATFRQEFRSFFEPDFQQPDMRYQLRSRFKLQSSLALDQNKTHRISMSVETFFSSSESTNPENHWSTFSYQESRICLYYSFGPQNSSVVYSIGYMNDLKGTGANLSSGSYIAFDVIWENPFKRFTKEILKPIE